MWKSSAELDVVLGSLPETNQLGILYALSVFWKNCIFLDGYKASEDWTTILTLSAAGEKAIADLSPLLTGLPAPDVMLAFFSKFFHHDLLFDYQRTDSSKIRELFDRELLQERVLLPHRFGRGLYDRFNDTYLDTRTDHLMSEEAGRLLQGTPIGVYQLGHLVSGPLGIIASETTRFLPPVRDLPLWHCSDTGCNALHDVTLVQPKIPAVEAYSIIKGGFFDRLGPSAEWSFVLRSLLHGETPRQYIDLPAVIADCIIGEELANLLERTLRSERGATLRGVLAQPPRRKRDAEGPPREIVSRLSAEARLQLLLVLSNETLVTLIDEAVASRSIRIPLGETREISYDTPRHSSDSGSQLSPLGIRSVKWEPVVNLTRAIWRAILGVNPLGTLLRYLRATADWIQGLPARNPESVKRPERDLPHFADSDYLRFPFRHTSLWADSSPTELQRHSELFARIVKLVEESDPANVRNGLDHFRDPDQFP